MIPLGPWTPLFQALGYVADGETIEFNWMGDKIIEWDAETKEEVWSWNTFDYFNMSEHDTGGELWWNAYVAGRFDWLHCNSFFFDSRESAIYISIRHKNQITKISYPSGEVLFSIGLSDEHETGSADNICNDLLFSWQHHVTVLENGDLLFFDNGNLSDTLMSDDYRTSRVRRIKVNDDYTCESEYILAIKCKADCVKQISNIINAKHNYEIPEIISIDFKIASRKYKDWFNKK